jgi:diguanylate cyclase (GGDEF)-like protein
VEIFSDLTDRKTIELRIKELEEMAFLDALTRLANRRYMEREIRIRLEEYRRFRIPFGVLFMDIDHFKRINDTHGHDFGDRVLRFTADTMVKNARPFDVLARWGGEEFLGLVRNINVRQLEDLGERLRRLVAQSYIPLPGGELHATISLGATIISEDDTIDSIIKRADALLYESKKAGRNRLTLG